jgi:hypothetical protein
MEHLQEDTALAAHLPLDDLAAIYCPIRFGPVFQPNSAVSTQLIFSRLDIAGGAPG